MTSDLIQIMLNALKAIEWGGCADGSNGGHVDACPFCNAEKASGEHTEDCLVALAIRGGESGT